MLGYFNAIIYNGNCNRVCIGVMKNENFIDLTNKRFGNCVALESFTKITKSKQYVTHWKCLCDCGNIFSINSQNLRNGKPHSCGCIKKPKDNSKQREHIGEKYNKLEIIGYIEPQDRKNVTYNYLCKCDCGNVIPANISKLKNGHTKSCGCNKEQVKEMIGNLNRKYKYPNKRLYSIFKLMHRRCTDPNDIRYSSYGGRGIKICKEWEDYDAFSEWALNNGYNSELTIDRIDVNGDYEPKNCRWITNQKQQNNRRNCHYIEYNGETHTVTEWARILNIPIGKFRWHIQHGKTIQQTLNFFEGK